MKAADPLKNHHQHVVENCKSIKKWQVLVFAIDENILLIQPIIHVFLFYLLRPHESLECSHAACCYGCIWEVVKSTIGIGRSQIVNILQYLLVDFLILGR